MSNPFAITAEEYEIARRAVEDVLIDLRDARISLPFRRNGLVVRESDGSESSLVRLGAEDAIRIGLEAILKHRQQPAPPSAEPREGEK